ncbi:hypothetical protein As57867_010792, partial [Aphanomyces stellatus]
CLARALVRKPTILLLDEATSALDAETEASIVETLGRLARQLRMAVVSVTHRLSTTRSADSILVMQNGRVVDRGTYHELLGRPNSPFAELMHKGTQETTRRGSESRNSLTRASFGYANPFADEVDVSSQRALEDFAEGLRVRAESNGSARSRKNSSFLSDSGLDRPTTKRLESDNYVVL